MFPLLIVLLAASPTPLIDNAWVRVTKGAAPCAEAAKECGRRIIVALEPTELAADGQRRMLSRGEIAVFDPPRSYSVRGDGFLEIAVKPGHPAGARPQPYSPPEKNTMLYDGDEFFIFEEKLDPGDTRSRHGHAQRLVVVVNQTRLQQWPDNGEMLFKDQVADDVHFNEPVVHVVKTVGEKPLRNIVIEFKPAGGR